MVIPIDILIQAHGENAFDSGIPPEPEPEPELEQEPEPELEAPLMYHKQSFDDLYNSSEIIQ